MLILPRATSHPSTHARTEATGREGRRVSGCQRWPSAGSAAGGHASSQRSLVRLTGSAPPRPGCGSHHPLSRTLTRHLAPPTSSPNHPQPLHGPVTSPISRHQTPERPGVTTHWPAPAPSPAASGTRREPLTAPPTAAGASGRSPQPWISPPSSGRHPPPAVSATGAHLPLADGHGPACGRRRPPLPPSLPAECRGSGRQLPPPAWRRPLCQQRPPPATAPDPRRQLLRSAASRQRCPRPTPAGWRPPAGPRPLAVASSPSAFARPPSPQADFFRRRVSSQQHHDHQTSTNNLDHTERIRHICRPFSSQNTTEKKGSPLNITIFPGLNRSSQRLT